MPLNRKAARLSYEGRVVMLALLAGLPGTAVALLLLWTGGYSPQIQWTLTVLVIGALVGLTMAVRERVVFPLQTLSNLLAALREGDFSVRGRSPRPDDALGEVMREVNTLGGTLREQRLDALEATTLLRTVMREIDVAIFAFDGDERLRMVNGEGARIMAAPPARLLGMHAKDLGLEACLEGEPQSAFQAAFPGAAGRWGMRRTLIREHGLPLVLIVISDITKALSEQELEAWQRLVRVLGHELNNSLAPIKSISGSLESLLAREALPEDWRADMRHGLGIIAARSEGLSRFVGAYARLAKLPRPRIQPLDVASAVARAAGVETRLTVEIEAGPRMNVPADADQLDQLLINLLRNAADAALPSNGRVTVTWRRDGSTLEIRVSDEGPGLSNTANLFVPFFTTKPGGSGIGLVLGRQIAEAHGGSLSLENRADRTGSVAVLRLPC